MTTFKAIPSNGVFNHFHIESLKRLLLITHLLDPVYKNTITNLLNQHKKVLTIKPLDVYNEITKLLNNVNK